MKKNILRSIFCGSKTESSDENSAADAFDNSLIDNIPDMVFIKDAKNLKYVYLNKAGEVLLGRKCSDVIGKTDHDIFPREQAKYFAANDFEVIKEKKTIEIMEEPVITRKKGARWIHTKKIPLLNTKGEVDYVLGISEDITIKKYADEQKILLGLEQAARHEAERNNRKLLFLSEAGNILGSSLEFDATIKALAQLIIPGFADWYAVHDLEKSEFIKVLICSKDTDEKINMGSVENFGPLQNVLDGRSEYIENMSKFKESNDLKAIAEYETLKALGIKSYISVPLKVRKKTIGALSLGREESAPPFAKEDLLMAQELANRIAIARDNSNLYIESQRLNKVKDEFLSTISHELRTPLNVILGHAEMLAKDELSDEEVQYSIDAIYRNSKLQNRIVHNLLDISSILKGKVRFTPMSLDPRAVLFTTINALKQTADLKNIVIHHDIHEESVKIIADPIRLREALWNLLMNAVKFSTAGADITVRSNTQNQHLNIYIIDTGQGISPQFLPHVFERFTQEDSSITRNESGLGVGLSIVKGIVELHGGVISVHSEGKGKGTTFTIRLPLAAVQEDIKPKRSAKTTGPIPRPRRKEILDNI